MSTFRMMVDAYGWFLLGAGGLMWLAGVILYIYALIKTRTFPCQLSDVELFDRIFKNPKRDGDS